MRHIAPLLFACLSAISLAALPTSSISAEASPVGQWEVASGESRYHVSFCGSGKELCARLTWLRDDAKTEENLALLNDFVVTGARPDGENTWVGTMTYDGATYEGRVKLVENDSMQLQSCSGLLCRSFTLRRL